MDIYDLMKQVNDRQHSGILPPTIAVTDDNRESQTLFCR
jgi:hypothetical protein